MLYHIILINVNLSCLCYIAYNSNKNIYSQGVLNTKLTKEDLVLIQQDNKLQKILSPMHFPYPILAMLDLEVCKKIHNLFY